MSAQTGTPTLALAPAKPAIGFFERWLSLWVFLCIVTGIALGQWVPAPFQALGRMEVARVNIPGRAAHLGDDHPDAAAHRLRRDRPGAPSTGAASA